MLSLCHLQHLDQLHSIVNCDKVFATATLKTKDVLAGSWGFSYWATTSLLIPTYNPYRAYISNKVKFYPMRTCALRALKCFQISFSTCNAIQFEPLQAGPNSWQPVIGSCEILYWLGTNGAQSNSFRPQTLAEIAHEIWETHPGRRTQHPRPAGDGRQDRRQEKDKPSDADTAFQTRRTH